MHQPRLRVSWFKLYRCWFCLFLCYRHSVALTGAEDSESCENRNGAASALLHIDESDGVDEISRPRTKSKRRSEPRQVQTGEGNTKYMGILNRPELNVNALSFITM